MRPLYFIGALMLLAAAAMLVTWGARWPRTSYRGRGLAHWLGDLRHPSPLVQERAQDAVRHMGSNAVPILRQRLHATDSPVTTNIVYWLRQQTLVKIPFTPARERRIAAALACVLLGPETAAAIPDLLEFSQEDSFCSNLAESALSQIGEPAVGPLSLALANASYSVRLVAAGALARMGPPARAAIPALTNCLRDDFGDVQAGAARALGRIGVVSPEIVRALLEASGDPEPDVRAYALGAVINFGRPAVPLLSALPNDADASVRTGAERALKVIEAAEKARAR